MGSQDEGWSCGWESQHSRSREEAAMVEQCQSFTPTTLTSNGGGRNSLPFSRKDNGTYKLIERLGNVLVLE